MSRLLPLLQHFSPLFSDLSLTPMLTSPTLTAQLRITPISESIESLYTSRGSVTRSEADSCYAEILGDFRDGKFKPSQSEINVMLLIAAYFDLPFPSSISSSVHPVTPSSITLDSTSIIILLFSLPSTPSTPYPGLTYLLSSLNNITYPGYVTLKTFYSHLFLYLPSTSNLLSQITRRRDVTFKRYEELKRMGMWGMIGVFDEYAEEGWQGRAGVDLVKVEEWRERKEKEAKKRKRDDPRSSSSSSASNAPLISEVMNFTTSKSTKLKSHLTSTEPPPTSPTASPNASFLSLISSGKNGTLTYSTLLPHLQKLPCYNLQQKTLLLTDCLPSIRLTKKTTLILPTLKELSITGDISLTVVCLKCLSSLSKSNKKYRKQIDDIVSMIYTYNSDSTNTISACLRFYDDLICSDVKVLINPILTGIAAFSTLQNVDLLCGVVLEGLKRWRGEEIGRMYGVLGREIVNLVYKGKLKIEGVLMQEVGGKVKNEIRILSRENEQSSGVNLFEKFSITGGKWAEFVEGFIEELKEGGVEIGKEEIVGGRRKKYLEFLKVKGFSGVCGLVEWVGKKETVAKGTEKPS